MNSDSDAILSVPTNIITGFLGVGKTTAILDLLKQKPTEERWAVLVNEFGEVGIDGSLFQGTNTTEHGIYIREVPGGCMCCAAGLPMQIALNMLLARAKPHRLLIEPTGLGHPKEVLDALSAEHYRSVIDLRATLTLVDARKIHDERYTGHNTFNQQLEIADVIVANKADQYQPNDYPRLLEYLENTQWIDTKPVHQVSMGQLEQAWLESPSTYKGQSHHHHPMTEPAADSLTGDPELPPCGYLSISNQGEGFQSKGWIFKPTFIFNRDKLYQILTGVEAERVKGVFITDQGVIGYNKADNVLTEFGIDDAMDSRIECIAMEGDFLDELEEKLLSCVNAEL